MKQRLAILVPIIAAFALLAYFLMPSRYCDSAYDKYGLKLPVCPDGSIRQVVTVEGQKLKRSGNGQVQVSVQARYTTDKADEALNVDVTNFSVELFLVDDTKKETKLNIKGEWKAKELYKVADVLLPQVHDGDYLLRTKVTSKIGTETVDMKLALYSPAKIHLLTDRPLYEPGNQVQFRALVVRATDLSPIDNRSGVWVVRNPSGEVLLEEKAPAQEWGVVSGDFPLSEDAEEGSWTVSWRSGGDESQTSFTVKPFVLPRFRVETTSEKSYYQAGDLPVLSGSVVYASGAPVAKATLEISWSAAGDWPPPNEWIAGGELPKEAKTGVDGRFSLKLPVVPQDLRGRVTLAARISAVDPAGDRVQASASVLLSEDAIMVSAVTEFEDNLVENSNNRVYLRVTSPTGTPITNAKINVKRAWAPGDKGIDAELDSDGVTRIQFDPGRPINVVIPPMPVRQSLGAAPGAATLSGLRDYVSDQQAGLSDMIAAESWLAGIQSCSLWVESGAQNANLSFRVAQNGNISSLITSSTPLDECVAAIVRKKKMPIGKDRLYAAAFTVRSSELPTLTPSVSSSLRTPSGLDDLAKKAALGARNCLSKSYSGPVPWTLFWRTSAGSKQVALSWMKDTGNTNTMPAGLDRCILSGFAAQSLPSEQVDNSMGLVRYNLRQPRSAAESLKPQPTILQGYELRVSATLGTEQLGATTLRMRPGTVPNLRLRATPVLAQAGAVVDLAFFRGPDYEGDLPLMIQSNHEGAYDNIELKKKAKGAKYQLPDDAKGWYEFTAGGARALVFVRSEDELSLELSAGEETYKPGQMANISIQTKIAGKGAKSAVGLFGVDNSLSQIATLRGPGDLGSVRPEVTMQRKAFDSLDGQALSLGRIRGVHAAEATILRVQSVPPPGAMDTVLYVSAETQFAPISELTDLFYIALAELHLQTRAWESSAAKGTTMTPKQMAILWDQAIEACEKKGHSVVDPYGRPMRLHWLPSDLLALVDPAQVVADATRLAEDVENWQQWVMKEQP